MGFFSKGPRVQKADVAKAQELVSAGAQFIDVRSRGECKSGMPKGAKNIPLASLEAQMKNLDPERPVVCICLMGARSNSAAKLLLKNGFTDVHNVAGGTVAWQRRGAPWS